MPSHRPSEDVDLLDRLFWYSIVIAILGWSMVALGLVGEHLGWWNDVGQAIINAGSVAGVVASLVGLFFGASRPQLRQVTTTVADSNQRLKRIRSTVASVDGKLDKLDTIDGKLDKLDVIQVELDRQTGAMDHQVRILGEIRDALTGDAGAIG